MLSTEILNSPYINDILDLGELEQKIHMIEKKREIFNSIPEFKDLLSKDTQMYSK